MDVENSHSDAGQDRMIGSTTIHTILFFYPYWNNTYQALIILSINSKVSLGCSNGNMCPPSI